MIPLQQIGRLNHTIWWKSLFGLSLFCLAVIGPGLWVQSRTQLPEDQFFLSVRREVPGWRFSPVSLDTKTKKILEASELFNGHFIDARSQRVSVFVGNWQPGQGDISSVTHTPEKCWVGTGFHIVEYGGPSQVTIPIGGRQISFQCRVLKRSDLGTAEITLWAACIDGLWDGIPYELPPEQIPDAYTALDRFQNMLVGYKNRWTFLCDRLLFRLNSAGRKQFVRLSTPLTTEWQPALVELVAFADRWLELD